MMDPDRVVYNWRRMTPEERKAVLESRQSRHVPWHGPPHYEDESGLYTDENPTHERCIPMACEYTNRKGDIYFLQAGKTKTATKMMRFVLVDPAKRRFVVQRWCFRGSIDDWIPMMGRAAPLPDMVRTYVQHLGKESFYDLM